MSDERMKAVEVLEVAIVASQVNYLSHICMNLSLLGCDRMDWSPPRLAVGRTRVRMNGIRCGCSVAVHSVSNQRHISKARNSIVNAPDVLKCASKSIEKKN